MQHTNATVIDTVTSRSADRDARYGLGVLQELQVEHLSAAPSQHATTAVFSGTSRALQWISVADLSPATSCVSCFAVVRGISKLVELCDANVVELQPGPKIISSDDRSHCMLRVNDGPKHVGELGNVSFEFERFQSLSFWVVTFAQNMAVYVSAAKSFFRFSRERLCVDSKVLPSQYASL